MFNNVRYQPDQPSVVYHIANSQEEVELSDGISVPSMGILPGVEERFSVKTLLFPQNAEPSILSGSTVNVCASAMGIYFYQTPFCTFIYSFNKNVEFRWKIIWCSSVGVLILAFSILAVQGGAASWNIVVLSVIFLVCLFLTFIVWRQPESKTKLSFKV